MTDRLILNIKVSTDQSNPLQFWHIEAQLHIIYIEQLFCLLRVCYKDLQQSGLKLIKLYFKANVQCLSYHWQASNATSKLVAWSCSTWSIAWNCWQGAWLLPLDYELEQLKVSTATLEVYSFLITFFPPILENMECMLLVHQYVIILLY